MGKKKKKKKPMGWQPPQTIPERIVVEILKKAGFVPIENQRLHGYFPDIRIKNTNLLIEIDGSYHFTPEQILKDETRTERLQREGYTVIRFTNKQVKDAQFIVDSVREALCLPTETKPVKIDQEITVTPIVPYRRKAFTPGRLLKMEHLGI